MFKFSELKYTRPDIQAFRAETEKFMTAFKNAENAACAVELFKNFKKLSDNFETMSTLAYIRSTISTLDKFYESEMDFYNEESPKLQLIDKEVGNMILSSPYRSEFERQFGSDMIKGMEASIKLADECIIDEQIEENKLSQEYSKLTATCTIAFKGENCNFYKLLKYMQSTDRNERKQAYVAWANLYESISDKLDAIYLRLVELRRKQAKKLGFSGYPEMALLSNGHYYYGEEDIAAFRKQVVEVIVPAVSELYEEQEKRLGVEKLRYYDEQLAFPEGNACPIGDSAKLIRSAREMYAEMSPETDEFFSFMTGHELFDLETREGKHMGGYCTYLPEFKSPFIFSNFNGTSADVDVLTHEAGHAFQAYSAAKCVQLSSQIFSTSDICEIHSMTMEHFAYPWMGKFFGDNADKYRYAHLSEALKVVPYLCLVDHFQYEVFRNDYDAKGLRQCWRRLEKIYMPWRDYDENEFLEEGGFWMQKQHIFLFPFYYIDYALAQMCAFEYYTRAKTDREGAWQDYLALCRAGGSKSYFELLKTGGLSNPFGHGSVKRAVSGILDELFKK